MGLLVVTLAGGRVSAITRFDNAVLFRFGFPRTLPGIGWDPGSGEGTRTRNP